MATGSNKDPSRIKKENQRVVRFKNLLVRVPCQAVTYTFLSWSQILGVLGLIGLTGLAYYAGFIAEGKRPKGYNERKSEIALKFLGFILNPDYGSPQTR
jgi:hypothetical protein